MRSGDAPSGNNNYSGARAMKLTVMILVSLAGCERYELDKEMEALCAQDGGIVIYKTVVLPGNYYDRFGGVVYGPRNELPDGATFQAVGGDTYRLVTKKVYIAGKSADPARGEGKLIKVETKIIRSINSCVLGKSIEYFRAGGDGFTFGFQPSSNFCPKPRAALTQQVFLKGK